MKREPVCRGCARRESVQRDASTPDVAPAPCTFCGVETRGRETTRTVAATWRALLREKEEFRYEVPQRPPGAPSRCRVVVTPDGRPWLVGGAVVTIPAETPLVRGRLTCEVCGQVVATGPAAETKAWAAFELGSTDRRGPAHFQTCTEARLALSFVLSDPPEGN